MRRKDAVDKMPFADLKRAHAPLKDALRRAACQVLDSGRYIGGPEVAAFEHEMAEWLGVEQVCGVSCATMGLFSTLRCMGVRAGDEVITTVHTAIATAEAISLTGAKVVLCDVRPGFFYLDPAEVERKITDRTRVIMPVHLYGQPADMDAILALAQEHGVRVVEDCAQAQGARYKDRRVGTLGDAAVFSFFPSKTLGGFGDGGAVAAKDADLLKRIRMFSNHGRESKYLHEFEGINSRLDALQAAMLRICLPHLDEWNADRRRAAAQYDRELAGIQQVTLPAVLPWTEPAYHLYVILVPDRDALQAWLKERGIETGLHYPYSLNMLPAYAHLNQGESSFPTAEYACQHVLSLPLFPDITEDEVRRVCAAIAEFFSDKS